MRCARRKGYVCRDCVRDREISPTFSRSIPQAPLKNGWLVPDTRKCATVVNVAKQTTSKYGICPAGTHSKKYEKLIHTSICGLSFSRGQVNTLHDSKRGQRYSQVYTEQNKRSKSVSCGYERSGRDNRGFAMYSTCNACVIVRVLFGFWPFFYLLTLPSSLPSGPGAELAMLCSGQVQSFYTVDQSVTGRRHPPSNRMVQQRNFHAHEIFTVTSRV